MRSMVVLLALSLSVVGQGLFGPQQVITNNANGATSVYATDLDGDGDIDVLSASPLDHKIAWYENLGGGTFGPQREIIAGPTHANYAQAVYAADLDGDGDNDVLSASSDDHRIAWYENRLDESSNDFGPQQDITTSAGHARSVYATDLDGDGDADVLVAAESDDTIAWYENRLDESSNDFGPQQDITTNADGAYSVYAVDLDDDGDADVVSASDADNKIAWYENRLDESSNDFGPQRDISTSASHAFSVFAVDLDGDGDADVLSASYGDDKIAWYENRLDESSNDFGSESVITTSAIRAYCVYATDLDGDGDADVLSASGTQDKIAWYENVGEGNGVGGGTFGSENVIVSGNFSNGAIEARSVFAADLDDDGDADVLSASFNDDKIAWYENLTPPPSFTYAVSMDASTLAGTVSLSCGEPLAPYFMLQSNDPLNAIAPGSGFFGGLHIPIAAAWTQFGLGLSGNPLFGGTLPFNGTFSMTIPGLGALPFLQGQTFWGMGIQQLPTGVYEPSTIASITF